MFQRTELKLQARARMRGFLGNAILVSLICAILVDGFSSFNFNSSFNTSEQTNIDAENLLSNEWLTTSLFGFILAVIGIVSVGAFLYKILFANVVKVGNIGWFMRYSRGEYPSVGELFASLRIYKPAMSTMLLHDIYIFLWSLLFIIPGIVKTYAYRLVPYIIYENPNLSPKEALRISQEIMRGNKLDLLVFDISYFFWNLLSIITCGIVGIVYVTPYHRTAEAYIYDALKHDAIYRRGIVTPEQFGMSETPVVEQSSIEQSGQTEQNIQIEQPVPTEQNIQAEQETAMETNVETASDFQTKITE